MLRQAQQAGFQLIELVEMRRFILQYNFEQLLMFLMVLSFDSVIVVSVWLRSFDHCHGDLFRQSVLTFKGKDKTEKNISFDCAVLLLMIELFGNRK